MRSSLVFIAVAGVVSAQTNCPAQNILDECLGTTGAILGACAPNDWECMCQSQKALVICYNNCPSDQGKSIAEGQQLSWCNAAKQLAPTSSSAAARVASSTAVLQAASSAVNSVTASASSEPATSSSNAAAGIVAPITGVLAIALGFLGLM